MARNASEPPSVAKLRRSKNLFAPNIFFGYRFTNDNEKPVGTSKRLPHRASAKPCQRKAAMSTLTRRSVCALIGASFAEFGSPAHAESWRLDGTVEALEKPIRAFFGNAKGQYIGLPEGFYDPTDPEKKYLLYKQFNYIFLQVPDDDVQLQGGFRMLVGCQLHWAPRKAFLVTSGNSNQIVAAGLLHQYEGKPGSDETDHTLTIFYSGRITSNPQINAELIKYYSDYLKEFHKSRKFNRVVKMKIEVRKL